MILNNNLGWRNKSGPRVGLSVLSSNPLQIIDLIGQASLQTISGFRVSNIRNEISME